MLGGYSKSPVVAVSQGGMAEAGGKIAGLTAIPERDSGGVDARHQEYEKLRPVVLKVALGLNLNHPLVAGGSTHKGRGHIGNFDTQGDEGGANGGSVGGFGGGNADPGGN